jgi:hypothetical protein
MPAVKWKSGALAPRKVFKIYPGFSHGVALLIRREFSETSEDTVPLPE